MGSRREQRAAVGQQRNRSTKNLLMIHFPARVLDHMLRVDFRLRTIADQMIEIVWTNRGRLNHPRLHRRLE
jgi:hypothetical protein